MSSREFSSHPDFSEYEYVVKDTGETFTSPFAVAVFGIRKQILGVGSVIGATNDDGWDDMPVIEVEDPKAEVGKVELLGAECWWSPLTSEIDDVVEMLAKKHEMVVPVTDYVKSLDSALN